MSSNTPLKSPVQDVCYFSIQHDQQSSYNDETPSTTPFTPSSETILSDPSNPLLAYRPCLQSPTNSTTTTNPTRTRMDSLLQLQTQAAHIPSPRRPQPQPLQNVLAFGDDSTESDDSNSSSSTFSSMQSQLDVARCSRCHRSQSINMSTGKATNMVSYGLNLFYCTRCANIVGFQSR